ncbi:MAG: hypothetical protein ACR2HE_06860 [Casimicrobiaceae bacterium]
MALMLRQFRYVAAFVALVAIGAQTGCGSKGPLTLPPTPPAATGNAPAPPASAIPERKP